MSSWHRALHIPQPLGPTQQWKGLLMHPQAPWQEDPALIHLKSTPLPRLPLSTVTLMALSLDLYHCVLEVAHHTLWLSALLWALQELACMLGCSDNLFLLIPLQERPEHTQQSKQGLHDTPDSHDKHHICPLVTDTGGKIPSSSGVSWLLQLLTKEEK